MSPLTEKKTHRVPPGLARVRKELPPPTTVFKTKREDRRPQAKEKLRRELQATREPY